MCLLVSWLHVFALICYVLKSSLLGTCQRSCYGLCILIAYLLLICSLHLLRFTGFVFCSSASFSNFQNIVLIQHERLFYHFLCCWKTHLSSHCFLCPSLPGQGFFVVLAALELILQTSLALISEICCPLLIECCNWLKACTKIPYKAQDILPDDTVSESITVSSLTQMKAVGENTQHKIPQIYPR